MKHTIKKSTHFDFTNLSLWNRIKLALGVIFFGKFGYVGKITVTDKDTTTND